MPDNNNKTNSGKRRPKIPRKVSATSLENAGLYYLGRFATSSENLRQVLVRRIMRAAKHHDTDVEACNQLVDDLIRRYLESGILNDGVYAKSPYQAILLMTPLLPWPVKLASPIWPLPLPTPASAALALIAGKTASQKIWRKNWQPSRVLVFPIPWPGALSRPKTLMNWKMSFNGCWISI